MTFKPHVLVVSTKVDISADVVVRELASRGVRWTRINTEDLPFDAVLTTTIGPASHDAEVAFDDRSLADVTRVWYRRVRTPERPEGMNEGVYDFCLRESRTALLGALMSARVPTMNPPGRVWEAENKPFQLAAAKRAGLRIPETAITNDPEIVRAAFKRFPMGMIVKPVRAGFVDYGSEKQAIYTSEVLREHLASLDSARLSPAIYQELLPKRCDVRVTVVGDKVFVAEIESQGDPAARVDWRRTQDPFLPHRRSALPDAVLASLKVLLSRLQLRFAAIDLVRTLEDDYVFLEVNPAGQWLWLDHALDFGIASSIVQWLSGMGD